MTVLVQNWMSLVGVLVCFLIGLIAILVFSVGVLDYLLRRYVDIRNEIVRIWGVESMILQYKRHRKEIDEYLKRIEKQK